MMLNGRVQTLLPAKSKLAKEPVTSNKSAAAQVSTSYPIYKKKSQKIQKSSEGKRTRRSFAGKESAA